MEISSRGCAHGLVCCAAPGDEEAARVVRVAPPGSSALAFNQPGVGLGYKDVRFFFLETEN